MHDDEDSEFCCNTASPASSRFNLKAMEVHGLGREQRGPVGHLTQHGRRAYGRDGHNLRRVGQHGWYIGQRDAIPSEVHFRVGQPCTKLQIGIDASYWVVWQAQT